MTAAKFELKAAEYRARAAQATAAAEASPLDRARELHETSAQRWTELAEAEETRAHRLREPPV